MFSTKSPFLPLVLNKNNNNKHAEYHVIFIPFKGQIYSKQGSYFDGTSDGTSEKLRRILKSHKTRSTFYTESTLRKLLCKLKDRVVTKHKNNIAYEINCSNCEAVYFDECKRSLKSRSDEHKRSARNSLMFGIWTLVLFL